MYAVPDLSLACGSLQRHSERASAASGTHHDAKVTTMSTTTDLTSRLDAVKASTAEALRTTEADRDASVVTVAVVREFDTKADKSRHPGNDAPRDSVIELEQAGDSAKAAAEADPGLGSVAREAVLAAHLAICILKTEV